MPESPRLFTQLTETLPVPPDTIPLRCAVFPEIAKGGLIAGGAFGEGVVYVNDQVIGYAELNQASIGAQLGGQTFSELIVFRDRNALDRLMGGNFDFGVDASAIIVKTGAARSASFEDGQAVFVKPRGGLMAELSVSGQQIDFVRL